MTNEERDIISQFVARVSGVQPPAQPSGAQGGSVPATQAQPLPPVDPEADQHIRGLFQRLPEAPYRLTQLAFVQEHALTEAQNRIQRLEWELQQAQQAAQAAQQQAQQPASAPAAGGGFFGGLFGGRSQAAPQQSGPGPAWNQGAPPPQPQYQQPAPPPPQYPPSYQPGVFQNQAGSGFFGSALRTAAGVAGGVVAADALMSLFSPHREFGGGFGGAPMYGGGAPFGGSPWGGAPAPDQGYVDQGSWDQTGGMPAPDQNYVDNGSWDQPNDPTPDSSWNDGGSSDGGGGWDSGGGDMGGGDSGGSDSLC